MSIFFQLQESYSIFNKIPQWKIVPFRSFIKQFGADWREVILPWERENFMIPMFVSSFEFFKTRFHFMGNWGELKPTQECFHVTWHLKTHAYLEIPSKANVFTCGSLSRAGFTSWLLWSDQGLLSATRFMFFFFFFFFQVQIYFWFGKILIWSGVIFVRFWYSVWLF